MRLFYNLDQIIHSLCERLGSGDGERKTLLTRQIAFEPLPASVLFALVGVDCIAGRRWAFSPRMCMASSGCSQSGGGGKGH